MSLIAFFVFLGLLFMVVLYGLLNNPPNAETEGEIRLGNLLITTFESPKRRWGITSSWVFKMVTVIVFGRAFFVMWSNLSTFIKPTPKA